MKCYRGVNYYTFSEVIYALYNGQMTSPSWWLEQSLLITIANDKVKFVPVNKNVLGDIVKINNSNNFEWAESHFIPDLMQLVLTQYRDDYPINLDEDISDTDRDKEFLSFFVEFMNHASHVVPRYLILLKAYDDVDEDWLKNLINSTSATSRFNDTPQDGGDYSDDEHTTNITQSVVSSDSEPMTPMERIRELQESIKNLKKDFIDEFDKLFLRKENIG